MTALIVVLGMVVALLAVLVVGLLRSHAEILRRLHELGAGVYEPDDAGSGGVVSPVELTERPAEAGGPALRTREGVPEPRPHATAAHDVVGTTATGDAKVVGVVGQPHTTLLAFLSTGCGTCGDFWRAFASGEAAALPGRDTRLVVVTKGPEEESPTAVAHLAAPDVDTVMSTQAFADYGVPVAPYVILVDGAEDRVIGEGAAGSWEQVANLLRQAAADAGLATDGTALRRGGGRLDGAAREARADDELLAAGITPGHASLYPDRLTEPDPEEQ